MSRRTSKKNRRKRRKSPFRILILVVILITGVTVGIILLEKYRTYSDYRVERVISMNNSEENTEYYLFANGYPLLTKAHVYQPLEVCE